VAPTWLGPICLSGTLETRPQGGRSALDVPAVAASPNSTKYGYLSRWHRQPTVPGVTAFEQPANISQEPLAVGEPTEDGRSVTREQGASQPAGRT